MASSTVLVSSNASRSHAVPRARLTLLHPCYSTLAAVRYKTMKEQNAVLTENNPTMVSMLHGKSYSLLGVTRTKSLQVRNDT